MKKLLFTLIFISTPFLQAQQSQEQAISMPHHHHQGDWMLGFSQELNSFISRPAGGEFVLNNRVFGGKYLLKHLFVGAYAQLSRTLGNFPVERYYALGALGRHYFFTKRISPFVEANVGYHHYPPGAFDPLSSFIINPSGGYLGGRVGAAYRFNWVGIEASYGQQLFLLPLNQPDNILPATLELALLFHL